METENIFRTIFIIYITAILAVRIYYYRKAGARRERRTRTQEGRFLPVLRMASGAPGILALALWLVNPAWGRWSILDLPTWCGWLGAALAPVSLALLVWVHFTLDTNFSPTLRIKERHQLIMHGPYRYTRHPMYTALMLVGAAVILLSANWVIAFVTVPAMTVAVALRIPKEEAMMIELFGAEYEHYRQSTGLVLPRLPHLRQAPEAQTA